MTVAVGISVVSVVADASSCWGEIGVGLAGCAEIVDGAGCASVGTVSAVSIREHGVAGVAGADSVNEVHVGSDATETVGVQ